MISNELAYRLIVERGFILLPDKEYADPRIKELAIKMAASWDVFVKLQEECLSILRQDPDVQSDTEHDMTDPIRPEEVVAAKKAQFPGFVLDAFNAVIAKHFHQGYASFRQDEVVEEIVSRMPPLGDNVNVRSHIFEQHWLDVEDIYRKAGWKVEYDKPDYCESYPATFSFRKKKDE